MSVRSVIVTSNFPPVLGGSCIVYSKLAEHGGGLVSVLAPSRDFHSGELLAGAAEHDRAAGFPVWRLDVLRPYETAKRRRGGSLGSAAADLAVMARVFASLAWRCLRHRIDVVCIGDLVYGGWLAWPMRHLLRRRVVIYVHGEELTSGGAGLFERWKGAFLRTADGIVAVSKFAHDAAVRHGADPARIEVILNGVDLDLFQPRPPDPATRARYAPGGQRILLTVARLIERKGVDTMLHALPAVLRRVPGLHYVVVGDGPDRGRLEALRVELGLQPHVTFAGAVSTDQLLAHYSAADLFVMPNRELANGDSEGFGLVFLEANASGKAVIAGQAGGTSDAVTHGEGGLLVDGASVDAVADAVAGLLADDPGRQAMAERGLATARLSGWPLRAAVFQRFTDTVVRQPAPARRATRPPPRPVAFPVPSAGPAVPQAARPELLVIIDAEEEFEWTTFSPDAVSVENMRHQVRAQRVFERYGLRPSYMVDFPVASQADGYLPLRELLDAGACDIGSQLHPWVNPPFGPTMVGVRDSYPGNLARGQEQGKIDRLTQEIEANLGVRPTMYRAGRYGAGVNTRRILTELGYTMDCSVLPSTDLSRWGGPDYSGWDVTPAWLDLENRLLELPVTSALTGALAGLGAGPYGRLTHPIGQRLHLPGVFARLGLLERIKLTPEGTTVAEAQRLTRALLARGQRTFVVTYHTSSLEPGFTPYVRTQAELGVFLAWLDEYCAWFMGEVGGVPSTAEAVYGRALAALPA